MYALSTHIWLVFMVNVGKYTIHGCYIGCGPPPDFGKVLVGRWPSGRVQKTPKLIYPDAQCFCWAIFLHLGRFGGVNLPYAEPPYVFFSKFHRNEIST